MKLDYILLWSCCNLPSTETDRHEHALPSPRDGLVEFVYDRQKSQITENVIWKLKNGDMLNEKLSIYFCNIDFFISLKNVHFEHFFSSRGEKKSRVYNKHFPVKKVDFDAAPYFIRSAVTALPYIRMNI